MCPNFPASFHAQSFFSFSQDGKCHPFLDPAVENLASSFRVSIMGGVGNDSWSNMRKYHVCQGAGASEDGVGFICLSPSHDIYVGTHSRLRPGSHPALHFADED